MITDDRALVLYLAKTGMWDLKWPGFEKNREKFLEKKNEKEAAYVWKVNKYCKRRIIMTQIKSKIKMNSMETKAFEVEAERKLRAIQEAKADH